MRVTRTQLSRLIETLLEGIPGFPRPAFPAGSLTPDEQGMLDTLITAEPEMADMIAGQYGYPGESYASDTERYNNPVVGPLIDAVKNSLEKWHAFGERIGVSLHAANKSRATRRMLEALKDSPSVPPLRTLDSKIRWLEEQRDDANKAVDRIRHVLKAKGASVNSSTSQEIVELHEAYADVYGLAAAALKTGDMTVDRLHDIIVSEL